MPATLSFPDPLWGELSARLDKPVESAAVLVVRVAAGPDDELTLCARQLVWVPDETYLLRQADQLVIPSAGWVPALGMAAEDRSAALFVHTHPARSPVPSSRDLVVDDQLAGPFRLRTRQSFYGSVIVAGTSASPLVGGRVLDGRNRAHSLRAVRIVGGRLRVLLAGEADGTVNETVYDRQIRAFGACGQRLLGRLHLGVVGAGGTGSAVIEQLTRAGVGRLTIVDPKALTAGNVTRVHSSTMEDVGANKAALAADRAIGIGLKTAVTWFDRAVTERDAAWALRHCDAVFGCTDDHAGRSVLSRLGYWYLYPVIDTAVLVDPDPQSRKLRGIVGRVTVAGPGATCLVCRGRVDLERAAAETLDPDERTRLAQEGYVPGLDDPDPSVVAFTTNVGATAVGLFLDRLFGFSDEPLPTELLLMLHDYEIRRTARPPRPGCYCTRSASLGAADSTPFLDRTWI